MTATYHIPVMLSEAIDGLNVKADGIYIDATFGGGGHSRAIFDKLNTGRLVAFDQDKDAQRNVWESDRFILLRSNFRYLKNFVEFLELDGVDGILADLGLSAHHISQPERGFSFKYDAPLDMRMNTRQSFSAIDVVNSYDIDNLTRIFLDYGELKQARRIALAVIKKREQSKIKTTFDLVETVRPFVQKKAEHKFLAKIFQAIRIEVNDEINTLKDFLTASVQVLRKKGRLVVISYHSLEDKLVKNFFRTGNFEGNRQTDIYGNLIRPLEPVNRKVIVPSEDEINKNNKARSAKLRIAEKI